MQRMPNGDFGKQIRNPVTKKRQWVIDTTEEAVEARAALVRQGLADPMAKEARHRRTAELVEAERAFAAVLATLERDRADLEETRARSEAQIAALREAIDDAAAALLGAHRDLDALNAEFERAMAQGLEGIRAGLARVEAATAELRRVEEAGTAVRSAVARKFAPRMPRARGGDR